MSYCPPCDTEFPLLCEPLETTANGKDVIENPLPEGVIEKDEDVITNEDGSKSVVK